MQVAYTNHIGHSSRDTHSGKSTAISTLSDLGAVNKHNNHDYTELDVSRMQSNINLELRHLNQQYEMSSDGKLVKVEGQLDLEGNVRKIYDQEFSAAIAEFNKKQRDAGHPERQIVSYIDKISHDKQQEVAVEGLLQIGSLEDWQGKTISERLTAAPILMRMLEETLAELNHGDGRFVLAGASLHMNEGTPHVHYVGVPIQDAPEAKRGLKTRVKKSAVFTKDSLGTGLQDNVRAKIEPLIEEAFGWTFIAKKTGRNEDRDKNTQVNEILKEKIHENQKVLSDLKDQNQQLRAVREKQHAEIVQNDRTLAVQEQAIYDNDVWIAEQEQTMADLEEHVQILQTLEEYQRSEEAIEEKLATVDDVLTVDDALAPLHDAHRLFKHKEAETFIAVIREKLEELFRQIRVYWERMKDYERRTGMDERQRRSPGLEERIRSAEDRSKTSGLQNSTQKETPSGSSSDDGHRF